MKNKIVLSLILGANLFALDINSAVDLALKNNFALKQQQYILDESKANLDGSYSGYKPKLDLNYNYNSRDKLITGQVKKDSTFNATVSYNLFNGFFDKYNIDALKGIYSSSKYTLEAKKQDLVLDVKSAYIDYLLKQKQKNTFNEALKLYEIQYNDSKNFYNQGLIAQNELLEVEVQMLSAKQNLQKAKGALKIAKQKLENIMGKRISKDESLKELEKNSIEKIVFDETLLENRSELKALESMVKSYSNMVQTAKSNYYPKLNASFGYNTYGDDLDPKDRTGYPDSQSIGTLSLNWNLYNGSKDKYSMASYRSKVSQNQMALEDLKLQIQLQYENALENLETANLNFQTASKALETSKLNYEIVYNKVKEGISTNKDLIDANYLLTNAKQNYFGAYYDRYLATATIQRVLGVKYDR